MSDYVYDGWQSSDYNDYGDYYQNASVVAQSSASMVAQQATGGDRGISDKAPIWNGDTNVLDIWKYKLSDWEAATRIASDKRGFHVLSLLPPKVQNRLRNTIDRDRLAAKNGTWREEVSADDHFRYLSQKFVAAQAEYQRKLPLITAAMTHHKAALESSSGALPADILLERTVKNDLKEDYMVEPVAPVQGDVISVPAGVHEVHGDYKNIDMVSIFYGKVILCNVDYLVDVVTGTQMVKPINRYLYRLRRFLSCRRGRSGSIVEFLNDFQTRKAELYGDELYQDFRMPESLSSMMMLTFADVTDQQYVVLMGRMDTEDVTKMTEDKMEGILRNILGLSDEQKRNAYFAENDGGDAQQSYDYDAAIAQEWDEWHKAAAYNAYHYPEEHYYSSGTYAPSSGEDALWTNVYEALVADSNPPLMPGEPREITEDNIKWTFNDAEWTYVGEDWDETTHAYKAKVGKGGRGKRRRFPRKAKAKQKSGFTEAWERMEAFWVGKGGKGGPGQGKGGSYKGGKSGKGWFGKYVPDADFRRMMDAKRGKKGGFGGGKYGKARKGKAMLGSGELAFAAAGESPAITSKSNCKNSNLQYDTTYTCFHTAGKAKHTRLSKRNKRKDFHPHTHAKAKFLGEDDAGWCIWDIGCSKAVMSEHAKRPLLNMLKKAGIQQPQCNLRASNTRYSFADGDGTTKTPGYKADIASVFNGKVCRSEWEILDKGTTPPLFSLEQTKNLHIDAQFRPWGVTISSAKTGWHNKEIIEKGGHLKFNMIDMGTQGKAYTTGECKQAVPVGPLDTPAATGCEAEEVFKAPPPATNTTPTFVADEQWGAERSDAGSSDTCVIDLEALSAQANAWGGTDVDNHADKELTSNTVDTNHSPTSEFFALINSDATVFDTDPYTMDVREFCYCARNSDVVDLDTNSPLDVKEPNNKPSGNPANKNKAKESGKRGKATSNNKKPDLVGPYTASQILKLHCQWDHCPAGQMLKRLKYRDLPHHGLDFDNVNNVLLRCDLPRCQEMRKGPPKPQGSGLVPGDRNHIVCQDTFFPETPKFTAGVQHQIDALTRISVLTADSGIGPDTQDSTRAIAKWDAFYGAPKLRLTDNGPEYGQFYTDATSRNGSVHRTTPTYAAFSNGICERAHQKAKYVIEIVTNKNPKASRDDILHATQISMNQEVKANGKTPFEMMLGRSIRVPDFEENVALWEDAADIVQQEREKLLSDAKKALLEFYTDIQVKKALRAKLQRERGKFSVGSSVWFYRMGKQNTKDAWVGPAKVLAINGRLVIIQYGSICTIVHESRIRPYYPPITPEGQALAPTVDPVDLSTLPPQERGRHMVQNQGDLILEQIREQVTPLEVVDPIVHDPIPEVKNPFDDELFTEPLADPHGDLTAPGPHTPVRVGPEEFFIGTGDGSATLKTENPTSSGAWDSVLHGDKGATRSHTPGKFGEGGIATQPIPISPRGLADIKAELEDPFPTVEVSDFGPTLPHPPTRHSPPRKVTFPYPCPPPQMLETVQTRQRAAPKRYGKDPDPTASGKLVTVPEGDRIVDQGGYGLLTFEKVSYTDIENLHKEMRGIDFAFQTHADQLWDGKGNLTSEIDKKMIDLVSLIDETFAVDLQECPEHVYAVSERLMQDDTPMRELSIEEIEKHSGLVESARALEYSSFLENETFDCIKYNSIPPHPDGKKRRVMTSRELIQWKVYLNKVKVRVVLRGFQDDRRKKGLYHTVDSPTVRSDSVRLLYQLAADYGYDIQAWDLKTAFLQGFKYSREEDLIYWEPPLLFRQYFNIPADECCVALKSVYGLDDAPRQWYEKLATKLCEAVLDAIGFKKGGFGLKRHWLDPCLFFKHGFRLQKIPKDGLGVADPGVEGMDTASQARERLPQFSDIAIAGTRRKPSLDGDTCILAAGCHVDDIIAAGEPEELAKLHAFLSTVFKVGKRSFASDPDGLMYKGARIRKPEKHLVTVDMLEYEKREIAPIKFKDLPTRVYQKNKDKLLDADGQTHYRAINGKLIWVSVNTRCDISCMTSQASSVLGKATEADAIFINKIVDHVIDKPVVLKYYRLADIKVPRCLRGSCDAAFKRKDERDDKARGGYLLCVGTQDNDYVGLISYGTAKIHRICKSPTGAEAITISGLGDQMDNLYHLFYWFYPMGDAQGEILTDAFSVTSTQFKYCSDVSPNLTVDIAQIRSRVRDGLTRLKHQLGEYMAADGLTKATTVANKVLRNFLDTNILGAKGVDMVRIEREVSAKLVQAFAVGKIHPNNVSGEFVDHLAQAINCKIVGGLSDGRYVRFL